MSLRPTGTADHPYPFLDSCRPAAVEERSTWSARSRSRLAAQARTNDVDIDEGRKTIQGARKVRRLASTAHLRLFSVSRSGEIQMSVNTSARRRRFPPPFTRPHKV
jgi:hypothetical protein